MTGKELIQLIEPIELLKPLSLEEEFSVFKANIECDKGEVCNKGTTTKD